MSGSGNLWKGLTESFACESDTSCGSYPLGGRVPRHPCRISGSSRHHCVCCALAGLGPLSTPSPYFCDSTLVPFGELALLVSVDIEARSPAFLQPRGGHEAELGILSALFQAPDLPGLPPTSSCVLFPWATLILF